MHDQAHLTPAPPSATRKHALPGGGLHTRSGRQESRRAQKRAHKPERSPLGRFIASMLRKGTHADPFEVAQVLGKLGARILDAALLGELDGAAREHKPGTQASERPPVVWRGQRKRERATFLRRFLAFALIVLERVGTESRRACSRKLWLGHTYDLTDEGERVYRPMHLQGGLTSRVGVSVRELERYIALLQRAGILRAWQPMQDKTGRAPRTLPEHMRGDVYAYQVYELAELPRELREVLERFYRKPSPQMQREDAERAAMRSIVPGRERGATTPSASATAAAFLAKVADLTGPDSTADPPIPF